MRSSGVAALAVGNILGAALGFLIAVLLGRETGDVGLGVYATASAWIFPLSLAVDAGLSAPLTRDAAATPANTAGLVRVTLLARWLLGSIICLLLIIFAPFLTNAPASTVALRVGAPLVLLNPLVGTYTAVFRAHGRLQRVAALNIGMLTAQVFLTVIALGIGWGVMGAMLANVVSSGVQVLAAWGLYRRDSWTDNGVNFPLWGRIFAAWPFALASVLAAIQMRMGVALTELWVGAAAAGFYAAAYRFIEAGRLIPQAGFDALLPALSAVRHDPAQFTAQTRRAGLMVSGFGIIFSLGCLLFAGWGVPFLFGDAFAQSGDLLRGMGVALLPMSLKYWAGVVWIARGEERRVMRLNALALVGQLALSAVLIPLYGVSGAALALVGGEVLGAFLLVWRIG